MPEIYHPKEQNKFYTLCASLHNALISDYLFLKVDTW